MDLRVNLSKAAPALYKTIIALDKEANDLSTSAGIAAGFRNLLLLRASQLNGCAFCVRMHTHDALASNETIERVSVLPAWRETTYFTPKERALLSLVEALTQISHGQVSDAVYADAAAVLSKEEIAAVQWNAIVINAWNRIAIASRYPVGA